MRVIFCTNCFFGIDIIDDDHALELLGPPPGPGSTTSWPCPKCSMDTGLFRYEDLDQRIASLPRAKGTVKEALRWMNGVALPDEPKVTLDRICVLFSDRVPVKIVAHPGDDVHYVIVESIEFEGGVSLHFAAAPGGAAIYRISLSPATVPAELKELAPKIGG